MPVPASFLSKTRFLLCALAHALRQGGYRHFMPVPASFLSKTRLFTVRSRARLAARRVQTLHACTCEFSFENSFFYCALSRTPCRSFFAARIGGAAGLSTGASERSERVKRMSGSEPRIAWFLCRLPAQKAAQKKKNGELNEIL